MFIVEEFRHLKLQLQDVISATDNFDPNKLIGHGGFGKVYRGQLSLLERPCVAAFKRLDSKFGQGNTEFWKEVMMLSRCKHENLVSLLHFCFEGDERILVYEYASRGSLDRYLSDTNLTWIQRLKICVGVARGLNYLHDPMETKQRVLHRDIKSSNILLDEEWNAKVSDFGLSKVGPANQPHTFLVSNVVGTFGYCDPSYFETGLLSKESDVYSFGVVLFEVMCGRLCCEYRNDEMIRVLVPMWRKCFEGKRLDDIIFHDLKEQIQQDSLMTFSTIANRCLQRDHIKRPTMVEIVQELEVAIKQQLGISIIEENDEIKHGGVKLQTTLSEKITTRSQFRPHADPATNHPEYSQGEREASDSTATYAQYTALDDSRPEQGDVNIDVSGSQLDSRNSFVKDEETDTPLVTGSGSVSLQSDYDPSQVKVSEIMQFVDKVQDMRMRDLEYEVEMPSTDLDISSLQIIRNEELEELRELGSAAFGTVYHGKWRGTDVAIKRINKSCFAGPSSEQERLTIEFWQEADILSKLHHPNVVAFYGVVQDGPGGTLATVTEFMVDCSLRDVLLRKDRHLDRRKKLIIAMDAAFGMEYLHSRNIVHFDVKCDNLLVNMKDPSRPICKVGDFKLSKIKRHTLVSGGVRGTLPWMAPELLNGSSNKVSEKVDVFSFGIVLWEILTGEKPYANMHHGAIIEGVVNNTLRPPIPKDCDGEWRRLMEQCWAPNPRVRPSFTEITIQLRIMSTPKATRDHTNNYDI